MAEKKIRSIAKTFSWRILIFLYWVLFGYIFTGSFKLAGILGIGSIVPIFFITFMKEYGIKLDGALILNNFIIFS